MRERQLVTPSKRRRSPRDQRLHDPGQPAAAGNTLDPAALEALGHAAARAVLPVPQRHPSRLQELRLSRRVTYLIFRYHACMRTMTATEASRHFSDLLDAVERGETVIIFRGSHPIAEIGPAHRRTGADLRVALQGTPPPDEDFARNISAALAMVTSEVPDPWAGA